MWEKGIRIYSTPGVPNNFPALRALISMTQFIIMIIVNGYLLWLSPSTKLLKYIIMVIIDEDLLWLSSLMKLINI